MLADSGGPTFGDEHRAEQHAALSADGHVPFFWDPFCFPSPYPVYSDAPPLVIQPEPELSVQQPSSPAAPTYWYYCVDAKEYYPYTQQCPGGWLKVVPNTPAG